MAGKFFSASRLRKISQVIFLAFWVVLWFATTNLAWPAAWVQLPAQLDPLLAIAQAIASRALSVGMLLALVVIALTLVFGRAWCGWICPVGTVLDIFSFRRKKTEQKTPPETLRKGKFLLLAAILIAALFGNLTLLIFDPITLWLRTWTGGIGPALDAAFTAVEQALAEIPWMVPGLSWLDQALRPAVFPYVPLGSRGSWLPVLIFTGLILLNLLAGRFWCRYLCPLGGLLGLLAKFSLVRRVVGDECKSCGACSKVCPTGTIDPKRGYISDPAECTMCMDCLRSCPVSQIKFQARPALPQKQAYDPSRREFLAAGALTVAGLAVLQTDAPLRKASSYLIRPPGAINDQLLQKCLRCGLCMRACPTGALQPAVAESGVSGLFTPVLVPRLGYCQFSCNNCGQVCPVEAIPPLSLEEKQKKVIGLAFFDENRCLPWADGIDCIVCEEMCPLPEKAIVLEEKQITLANGTSKLIKLPRMRRELCIGCGICEYKCPRSGEAAIRVRRADI